MNATAALRPEFLPGLTRVLGSAESGQLEKRLRDRIELERLRKETDNDLAKLKVDAAWLAERFEQPAPDDLDPDWLAETAERAAEKKRQAEAHFRPVIAALKGALEAPNDSFEAGVQQLLRDGIEVLEGWLAFYQGFHKMLARQAVERRTSCDALHARPVAGEIDYAELSREHIARYPRIRAALAE